MRKRISSRKVGTINLSGKVIVSDPCYDREVWCNAKDIAVKPGEYAAYIVTSDQQGMGDRVASLVVVHTNRVRLLKYEWEVVSTDIGVDSGQCGIFDDTIYPINEESIGDYDDENSFYGECCNLTLSEGMGGILKTHKGVVSNTGFGDGSYALLCQYHKGECVALMVDFELEDEGDITNELFNT